MRPIFPHIGVVSLSTTPNDLGIGIKDVKLGAKVADSRRKVLDSKALWSNQCQNVIKDYKGNFCALFYFLPHS